MTDITREEFPREFPIFPKETTTPRLTEIEPDQETVVPEMQETSSKVINVPPPTHPPYTHTPGINVVFENE